MVLLILGCWAVLLALILWLLSGSCIICYKTDWKRKPRRKPTKTDQWYLITQPQGPSYFSMMWRRYSAQEVNNSRHSPA
ncbi:hypothetical protein C8R43DRAFT_975659 [Mycena crocata]|nr:hypothetical protein C8R43DRAFT_975659 [Mycena crocata]